MKKWAMIATWRMAVEGVTLGADILKNGGKCQDAVERAIMEVVSFGETCVLSSLNYNVHIETKPCI